MWSKCKEFIQQQNEYQSCHPHLASHTPLIVVHFQKMDSHTERASTIHHDETEDAIKWIALIEQRAIFQRQGKDVGPLVAAFIPRGVPTLPVGVLLQDPKEALMDYKARGRDGNSLIV
ncbi:hypothetical protein GYMLUDRAFT_409255 [Collybiopsis luxurians FD-317 M1]|uniref:Uncharacterized protein n=1 Tax=Collybiopsis luxurians FD-317 M1 TaxID=944289 RepID=A0A0D0C0D5_9AGAR|nr:hypothetical protein GYMLUDRAFT_409255 [Collybiopsis luxurians FD-317 M1]